MKYAKHIEERLKEPENSIEHWRQQVAEYGIDDVKKRLEGDIPVSEVWPISARQAVEEAEKDEYKQEVIRNKKRETREEETLELAREANRIARQARREMRYTWAAAVLITFLTFVFTFLLDQGS